MAGTSRLSEHVGDVYSTMNYERFKTLEGNREDIEKRALKIKESVDAVGYVPAPIIVNERFEIIDGQARFYYCKATERPIIYMVVPGLTIDHCIAMNISSTNWGIRDYIHSYAKRGVPVYCELERFFEESRYGFSETLWAASRADGGGLRKKIMSGQLSESDLDTETGRALLRFWARFDDIKTNKATQFLTAIGYCYLIKTIDNERLVAAVHKHPTSYMTITDQTSALRCLEEAYNYGTRYEYRIDFDHEFVEYISETTGAKVAAMVKANMKRTSRH